jgi:hypothetical protein
MYEKWLADDGKDLALTKKQIEEMRDKINEVQASQQVHEDAMLSKESALSDKESILTVRHLAMPPACMSFFKKIFSQSFGSQMLTM